MAIHQVVFSAAGRSGIAYAGAIRSLESRRMLDDVRTASGISSGAVVASMVALRLSAEEICSLAAKIAPPPLPRPAALLGLHKHWGLFDVRASVDPLVDAYLPRDLTFRGLRDGTGIDLEVAAFDVLNRRLVRMSAVDTPGWRVREALLASCAIPLYFRPVPMQGFLFVDGAVERRTPEYDPADAGCLALDVDTRSALGDGDLDFGGYLNLMLMTVNRAPPGQGRLVTLASADDATLLQDGFDGMEGYLDAAAHHKARSDLV
jgi:hypothetical protein